MKKSRVVLLATGSRILTFALQVFFNSIIKDHNADAFYNGMHSSPGLMSTLFSGLTRWDGQHFLDIATRGYHEEQNLAFFPLFPLLSHYMGLALNWLVPHGGGFFIVTRYDCLIMAAFLLNTLAFVIAALALRSLTNQMFGRDQRLTTAVVHVFCLNPASVFFTAIYSESIFCALTFSALSILERWPSPDQSVLSSTLIGLSCATRSNGLVTVGFLIHRQLARLKEILDSQSNFLQLQFMLLLDVIRTSSHAVMAIWPFLTYQLFAYNKFCNVPRLEGQPPPQTPEWCRERVPFAYNYVQRKYWGVSFLGYWEWKQTPNFILALPMIAAIFAGTWRYIKLNRPLVAALGIDPAAQSTKPQVMLWHNSRLLPYFVHASFLAAYCLFNAHVQIVTRLICSSSPLPYWLAAYCITRARPSQFERRLGRFMVGHFVSYYVIGIAMHVNMYPWT